MDNSKRIDFTNFDNADSGKPDMDSVLAAVQELPSEIKQGMTIALSMLIMDNAPAVVFSEIMRGENTADRAPGLYFVVRDSRAAFDYDHTTHEINSAQGGDGDSDMAYIPGSERVLGEITSADLENDTVGNTLNRMVGLIEMGTNRERYEGGVALHKGGDYTGSSASYDLARSLDYGEGSPNPYAISEQVIDAIAGDVEGWLRGAGVSFSRESVEFHTTVSAMTAIGMAFKVSGDETALALVSFKWVNGGGYGLTLIDNSDMGSSVADFMSDRQITKPRIEMAITADTTPAETAVKLYNIIYALDLDSVAIFGGCFNDHEVTSALGF